VSRSTSITNTLGQWSLSSEVLVQTQTHTHTHTKRTDCFAFCLLQQCSIHVNTSTSQASLISCLMPQVIRTPLTRRSIHSVHRPRLTAMTNQQMTAPRGGVPPLDTSRDSHLVSRRSGTLPADKPPSHVLASEMRNIFDASSK